MIRYRNFTKTYVIAEIGVNHNGSVDRAIELIDLAKNAGADAVKFQTFVADDLARSHTPKVKYQIETTGQKDSHLEMLRALELSKADFQLIKSYCDKVGIRFVSTPYSVSSVDLLEGLDVEEYKIASADVIDIPLLKRVAQTKKPVILSLGMATLGEIEQAIACFDGYLPEQLVLLHCISNYPCSDTSVNLRVLDTLSTAFPYAVGFSDHSIGSTAAVGSIVLGASVVEKHFTSDKSLVGPDHRASCEPAEFAGLVESIRKIEIQIGLPVKSIQLEESAMASTSRKSLVYAKNISKGTVLTEDDFMMMRPGGGLSWEATQLLIGKAATKALKQHNDCMLDDVR